MTSKLTNTGLQLDGTGTTQQTKVVVSVDGEVPNASGQISLSSTGQTLNTRVTNLENEQNPTNSALDARVTALENASSSQVGVSTNLFLNYDLAINNVSKVGGGDPQVWAKPSHSSSVLPYADLYSVPSFENFKTNSTLTSQYKLVFYSQNGSIEFLIADLIQINPSYSNPIIIRYDDMHYADEFSALFFDGNDLIHYTYWSGSGGENTRWATYRIDIHSYVDAPIDAYTKTEVDGLINGTGEQPGNNYVHVESQTVSTGLSGNYPQYVTGNWNTLSFNDLFPSLTENGVYLVTCYILWIPQNTGHSVYFRNPHPNGVTDNSTPYVQVIDPTDSALLMRSPNGGGSMMFTLVARRENANSVAIKYWPTQAASVSYLTFTSSHCLKIG